MKITEQHVVKLLLQKYGQNICISNYNLSGRFECDFAMITRAEYLTEFEIKLSLGDYKQDFYKQNLFGNKHELLSKEVPLHNKPSRFYFVIPRELIKKIEYQLPKYAGLIEFYRRKCYRGKRYLFLSIIKNAPRLHNRKISKKYIDEIKNIYRYRWMNLMCKFYDEGS